MYCKFTPYHCIDENYCENEELTMVINEECMKSQNKEEEMQNESSECDKTNHSMFWVCGWNQIYPKQKKSSWVIVYMDVTSRFIVSYGRYDKPTSENSIETLFQGIDNYGKPTGVFTSRKSPFSSPPDKTEDDYLFDRVLVNESILHFHLSEIQRKITPFWNEFHCRKNQFKTFDEYVHWHNECKPHSSLNYAFPRDVFLNSYLTKIQ